MPTEATKKSWCANGLTGYDVQTGKPYNPKQPCQAQARPGHIFCDKCREESGGRRL